MCYMYMTCACAIVHKAVHMSRVNGNDAVAHPAAFGGGASLNSVKAGTTDWPLPRGLRRRSRDEMHSAQLRQCCDPCLAK